MSADQSVILRSRDVDGLAPLVIGDDWAQVAQQPTSGRQQDWNEPHIDGRVSVDEADDSAEHEAAIAEAFAQGFSEGESSAQDRIGPALAALSTAAHHLHDAVDLAAESAMNHAVDLALELTSLLLRRVLAATTKPGADAIRRTLELLPHRQQLTFRLCGDDIESLGDLGELLGSRSFDVLADSTLSPGDVVVEYDSGSIDGRLSSALDRVAQELRS